MPFPLVSGQLDLHSAIRRRAVHVAAQPLETYAAVRGMELHVSRDALDSDPAVHGFQVQVGFTGHEQLVTNRPPLVARPGSRTIRADRPIGRDGHILYQRARFGQPLRTRLHLCTHEDLVSVPAFYADAAVGLSVHGDDVAATA